MVNVSPRSSAPINQTTTDSGTAGPFLSGISVSVDEAIFASVSALSRNTRNKLGKHGLNSDFGSRNIHLVLRFGIRRIGAVSIGLLRVLRVLCQVPQPRIRKVLSVPPLSCAVAEPSFSGPQSKRARPKITETARELGRRDPAASIPVSPGPLRQSLETDDDLLRRQHLMLLTVIGCLLLVVENGAHVLEQF
jgi:hypothetical protein